MKNLIYKYKQTSFPAVIIFTFYTLVFAIIHFGILILALLLHVWVVAVYEVFSVSWYLYCYSKKSAALNTVMYTISVVEVILNSFFCTYFFGWSYGFHIYLFLIPIKTYFVSYYMRVHNLGKLPPLPYSVATFATAVLLRSYSSKWVLPGDVSSSTMHGFIYDMNLVIYFGAAIFLLMAFYSSIHEMELDVQRKNKLLAASAADLKARNEDLLQSSTTDYLTGLLTRRSMMPCFIHLESQYIQNNIPFCAVIGDIDDFKKINDTHGHNSGDDVLVAVTECISSSLRTDDRICRWGGEEFLILLANCDLTRAQKTMERIRNSIMALRIPGPNGMISCTITFGVECYNGQEFDKLKHQADEKLYYGKHNGKNVVILTIPELMA
jgi:diguanylate cyclase (GGDEF)-like protein